jgi:hypothetical protein
MPYQNDIEVNEGIRMGVGHWFGNARVTPRISLSAEPFSLFSCFVITGLVFPK